MHQKQLIILRAQAEHAESKHQEKRARGDEWSMAILVKQRAGKACEAKGKECLSSKDERPYRRVTHDVIHDI